MWEAGLAATPEGPVGSMPTCLLAEAAHWTTNKCVKLAGSACGGLVVTVAVVNQNLGGIVRPT